MYYYIVQDRHIHSHVSSSSQFEDGSFVLPVIPYQRIHAGIRLQSHVFAGAIFWIVYKPLPLYLTTFSPSMAAISAFVRASSLSET